jgi:hypothetical protein
VLAAGLVEEDKVLDEEIDRALAGMRKLTAVPKRHILAEE